MGTEGDGLRMNSAHRRRIYRDSCWTYQGVSARIVLSP